MKRTMVLLGAGASAEAGVPMATQMVDGLGKYLEHRALEGAVEEAHHAVFRRALRSLSGRGSVDVESLLAALRAIGHRDCQGANAIVAWPPILDSAPSSGPAAPWLSAELSREVLEIARGDVQTNNPTTDEVEVRLVKGMLRVIDEYLHSVLWVRACSALYLRPLYHLIDVQGSVVVATLNYDTSVEVCAYSGHRCQTYAAEWNITGRFPIDGPELTLLKLHGSVNWSMDESLFMGARVVGRRLEVMNKGEMCGLSIVQPPWVIFGTNQKLQPNGPFLDLLYSFREALEVCDRLVIVGYSFRDEHINESIRRWLNLSVGHEAILIDPFFDASRDQLSQDLREVLAGYEDLPPRYVRIVRAKASVALLELQAEGIL